MIILTQLIYIQEGMESVFQQFEDIALPLITKYNGELILRLRPGNESWIAGTVDTPYEIHIVSFRDEQDFLDFGRDKDRKFFLHLKESSVRSVMLIGGKEIK